VELPLGVRRRKGDRERLPILQRMNMTPEQCCAARALLKWTQKDLAENADLSVWIVEDFEAGSQPISDSLVDAMVVTLEYAGVEFLASDNPDGVIVRFRT